MRAIRKLIVLALAVCMLWGITATAAIAGAGVAALLGVSASRKRRLEKEER